MQKFKKKTKTKTKNIHGSGKKILIISNGEMNDIMKIVQALEDSYILLKGVTETIKNKIKEQKVEFLSMLLGTLGASLLGIVRVGSGNKKEKGKNWHLKRFGFLMLPHPLTNFKIQKYYQNEPRFNVVFQEIICLKK